MAEYNLDSEIIKVVHVVVRFIRHHLNWSSLRHLVKEDLLVFDQSFYKNFVI